jgi:ATP-dependent protease ClpP protease subunit
MNQIALEGVVGLDVTAKEFRQKLSEAGSDVELLINSPGGVVTDGIAIFNAIRDHRRNGGSIVARVVGMAASMATYIPMAATSVEIEDNAIWMIHNPWGLAIGDQNEMRKEADILDGMASILARAYSEKTGIADADIRAMMDSEKWIYGSEIKEAGFADSVIPAGDGPEDRPEALAVALDRMRQAKRRVQAEVEEDRESLAAMVRAEMKKKSVKNEKEKQPVVDGKDTAAKAEKIEEGAMDIKALKNEHPEVFAEAVQIGAKQERERVASLMAQRDFDPDNGNLAEVVDGAIREGKALADVQTGINVAIRDGSKTEGENPPEVGTAQASVEKPASDEEAALASALGISVEELRAQGGEK